MADENSQPQLGPVALDESSPPQVTPAVPVETRPPRLLPVVLVLGVFLWIFTTTGGREIFVNEMLSEAYDSQAEHLLRGDPGVDPGAIRHESMVVNGQTRMYFGPFPAFVRVPLNLVYPEGRGNWSRITGFCAGLIALAAFAGLVRLALRDSHLSRLWRNLVGSACVVGFAFGSPLLLLLGNLSIYDEAIIWGLAWSLAALYFAYRSRKTEGGAALTWSLLAFSFCVGAALLSRLTFAAPLLLIALILALRPLRRFQILNLAALFLPLGVAVLFHFSLSYAKFGNFSGISWNAYSNPTQRNFARQHGTFALERVPYSFADYFFLRKPVRQPNPPYLKAARHFYDHPTLYVNSMSETYSSLLWCSSWILFGGIFGLLLLLRPRGADGIDRAMAALLFAQVIVIMSFQGLAQRYLAEFYPFLVFTFILFLARSRAILYHSRYLIIALVAVSVIINSLATVSWLLEVDMNVPAQTRNMWKVFLQSATKH